MICGRLTRVYFYAVVLGLFCVMLCVRLRYGVVLGCLFWLCTGVVLAGFCMVIAGVEAAGFWSEGTWMLFVRQKRSWRRRKDAG